MSERSVVTGIAALIDGGYFERVAGGGRGKRTRYRPCWETVKQTSVFSDPETLKQNVINTEVSRKKTLKHTSYETGNRNREETGNKTLGENAESFERFFTTYPTRRPHSNPRMLSGAIASGVSRVSWSGRRR